MANLLVGDEECGFNELVLLIVTTQTEPLLSRKWRIIANYLGLKDIHDIQTGIDRRWQEVDWAVEMILLKWRIAKAKEAKLNKLIEALKDSGLVDSAESIRTRFKVPRCVGKPISGGLGSLWKVNKANLIKIKILPPVLPMEYNDEDEYKLSVNGKRYALLINIIAHTKQEPRAGAIYDSHNLTNLLARLNYEVTSETDYQEAFTKTRLDTVLSQFKKKCVENKAESFLVFIGSHGEYGNIFLTNGDRVNLYDDIVYKLSSPPSNYPAWAKIPKVFLVSACRDIPSDSPGKPIDNAVVAYSTLPNKKSYRDPDSGTVYIKCFVQVMMKQARDTDFEEILKKVEDELWKDTRRQQPNYENYGLKKLYLNF